jgi:quercetin dioxygenase-like cupin family protein
MTTASAGIDVRLLRVAAGSEGPRDRHDDSTETAVVWTGSFEVAPGDRTITRQPGQCCVIAREEAHRGSFATGAEVTLFRRNASSAGAVG